MKLHIEVVLKIRGKGNIMCCVLSTYGRTDISSLYLNRSCTPVSSQTSGTYFSKFWLIRFSESAVPYEVSCMNVNKEINMSGLELQSGIVFDVQVIVSHRTLVAGSSLNYEDNWVYSKAQIKCTELRRTTLIMLSKFFNYPRCQYCSVREWYSYLYHCYSSEFPLTTWHCSKRLGCHLWMAIAIDIKLLWLRLVLLGYLLEDSQLSWVALSIFIM